jgi:multiple sugar transport system ATP-binding protein
MNFIPSQVVEADARGALVRVPTGELIRCAVDASRAEVGQEVTLGLRPEHLRPDATGNAMKVQVTFVESLGSSTQAYCALPGVDEAITCTLPGQSRIRDGQALSLGVDPADGYLFDAQGHAFQRHAPAAPQSVSAAS